VPTTLRGRVDVEGPYVWVKSGATVYTDEARAYLGLNEDFAHKSVNHPREYVCGSEAGDLDRVRLAAAGANGRRITYRQLTDKLAG
jgi:hypothetical protein